MSFSWGFCLGWAGFIIPAQIVRYLYGNSLYPILAGIAGAAIFIFALIVYLYNTVEFVERI